MKRTLLAFIGFLVCSWGSIQLWLAGYTSGYEQGSSTAWVQAREVLQPGNGSALQIENNVPQINWNASPPTAQIVENRGI